jgi:hypothetical protein
MELSTHWALEGSLFVVVLGEDFLSQSVSDEPIDFPFFCISCCLLLPVVYEIVVGIVESTVS